MIYLILKDELEKLSKGELKVEDLTIPEKMAVITISGEDIKEMLNGKEVDLERVMTRLNKYLSNCDCGSCVETALDLVLIKL
jgi:hypothetical protein